MSSVVMNFFTSAKEGLYIPVAGTITATPMGIETRMIASAEYLASQVASQLASDTALQAIQAASVLARQLAQSVVDEAARVAAAEASIEAIAETARVAAEAARVAAENAAIQEAAQRAAIEAAAKEEAARQAALVAQEAADAAEKLLRETTEAAAEAAQQAIKDAADAAAAAADALAEKLAAEAAEVVALLASQAAADAAAAAAELGIVSQIGDTGYSFFVTNADSGLIWYATTNYKMSGGVVFIAGMGTEYMTMGTTYIRDSAKGTIIWAGQTALDVGAGVVKGVWNTVSDDVKQLLTGSVLVVGGGVLLYAAASGFGSGVGYGAVEAATSNKRRKLK
jgi:hypothetical protein